MDKKRQLYNYLFLGACASVSKMVIYFFILTMQEDIGSTWVAQSMSWTIFMLIFYITTKQFVFQTKRADIQSGAKEFGLFIAASLISMAVAIVFYNGLVYLVNIKPLCAVIVNIIGFGTHFYISKYFVFAPTSQDKQIQEKMAAN
ncbi:GtrA family protein [Ectobacillus antri]|jgi:putative flippase GtrA|uniref:GtrA family protein n=1 Tax=Ectobacillus antri TaxID=2486280 RepID=A0ABT6H7P1_9BACI|nr:GtrA family protein [Ectobacillus antri]MDG4658264.1 GtrA family protein [Ectobacillus antri]MDG5755355.1 GtrA family protein [Ectobacillus antri]